MAYKQSNRYKIDVFYRLCGKFERAIMNKDFKEQKRIQAKLQKMNKNKFYYLYPTYALKSR